VATHAVEFGHQQQTAFRLNDRIRSGSMETLEHLNHRRGCMRRRSQRPEED
jgi:hypothetical protein